MKTLQQLESWFQSQCNNDWEHENIIKIETLDNPGWMITIPLIDTTKENSTFKLIDEHRTETNWLYCKKENGYFIGCSGVGNLTELLDIFINFVTDDSDNKCRCDTSEKVAPIIEEKMNEMNQ